jgi:hypothetical protein
MCESVIDERDHIQSKDRISFLVRTSLPYEKRFGLPETPASSMTGPGLGCSTPMAGNMTIGPSSSQMIDQLLVRLLNHPVREACSLPPIRNAWEAWKTKNEKRTGVEPAPGPVNIREDWQVERDQHCFQTEKTVQACERRGTRLVSHSVKGLEIERGSYHGRRNTPRSMGWHLVESLDSRRLVDVRQRMDWLPSFPPEHTSCHLQNVDKSHLKIAPPS